MPKNIHIIVVEASPILSEGLSGILRKSGLTHQLSLVAALEDIELINAKRKCDLIIISPSYIQNNIKSFNTLRSNYSPAKWLGLVYAYHDPKSLSMFDATITLSDTPEFINTTISNLLLKPQQPGQNSSQEILSERETDVLKLVATGMANKEIADKLNISTNTVISHRKNISQKTGIKSVAGLTLYAVVQRLIST